jgi:2-keto-3-deoxy-L-rhamnonate aldolase RhmA
MVRKAFRRRATRKGRAPALAFWLEYPSLPACEIAASLGYRIAILDMEHGVFSREAADSLVFACRKLGLIVYSRVATAERVPIQHALDSGVDGVILPQITDLAHAEVATALAKYPPLGSRGVGYSRTMKYAGVARGFFAAENRRTACFAMIETPGALRDVAAIVRLATVDGLFIGPADLSMTRGRGAFRASREDFADFRKVAGAAKSAGKPWAIPAPGRVVFAFASRQQASFVTVGDDLSALRTGLAQGLVVAGGR